KDWATFVPRDGATNLASPEE
ncbi:hypothetical protein A2U01_0079989, partial [Trifolium medium]|nr:hypothetical protein [Trifolium medium]